jgi:transcriptional regulator with XRE-family HTH domain
MSRVMKWIDEELRQDGDLAARVDADLTRLRVEQDLIVLREDQGLSQRELARRVGVSQPVIARIEAGTVQNLQLRTLLKIASALDGQVDITIRPRRQRTSRRTPTARPGSRRKVAAKLGPPVAE